MDDFDDSDAFEAASVPLSQRAMASAAGQAPYLDDLNPAQREAVEALQGPVLMLAGAGTGKTKALTARIAHLIRTGTARPNEILSVTFTNKAAREMKDRVARLLGQQVEGMPWLGTFHALSVKLLRRHAELVQLPELGARPALHLKSNFTILDTDDQLRLLKQLIIAANIDEKRWPPRMLSGIIDSWKNRAWLPEAVPAAEASAFDGKGVALYTEYQRRLLELNATDFGDLLLHVVTIFQQNPDLLERYRGWFRYILVDEYQDTNVAQYLWLRLLAGGHQNICCVGDDDQSIYGWRGAEVGNILRFEKDFPGAKVVRLEQNYRSTGHILSAASGVIKGNKGRLGKTLWTDGEDGEKVRLIGHWDGDEEARWIGEELEAMGQIGLAAQGNNGGSLDVNGRLALEGLASNLTITLNRFGVRDPALYDTSVDGTISVTGPIGRDLLIAGDLRLNETEIQVPSSGAFALGDIPEIRHLGATRPVMRTIERAGLNKATSEAQSASGPATTRLDLSLSAPNQVFVPPANWASPRKSSAFPAWYSAIAAWS